jgi:hypothetical protein
MAKPLVFVGIDVAQATLDVAVRPTGEAWQIANDEIAFSDLVERVRQLKPSLIVLEATGGIHLPVVAALAAAKLPVVAVNPRQARDFAKATGKLAKTDRIDARVLAHFAEAVRPEVRPLPDAATQELAILVARRRQLMEMRVAEQNRSRGTPARIRAQIREHVEWLNRQIDELDHEIGQRVRSSPAGAGRSLPLDTWSRTGTQRDPVSGFARIGHGAKQADRCACRTGAIQSGQRQKARAARDLGWQGECTSRAVHGHSSSHQAQSGHPGLLPTPSRHAQTQEGGAHCVHAQAAHDPQRYGSTSDPMVCGCAGARMISKLELAQRLTTKTVANAATDAARTGV